MVSLFGFVKKHACDRRTDVQTDRNTTFKTAQRRAVKTNKMTQLTLSLPIPLRLYTLPYWSNPPFSICDIRARWLSASAPECHKLKMVG